MVSIIPKWPDIIPHEIYKFTDNGMLAKIQSSAVVGVDGLSVEVEVDISYGLPSFSTVGLPEGAVRESRERVKAAIKNSGYDFRTAGLQSTWRRRTLKKREPVTICPWPSVSWLPLKLFVVISS